MYVTCARSEGLTRALGEVGDSLEHKAAPIPAGELLSKGGRGRELNDLGTDEGSLEKGSWGVGLRVVGEMGQCGAFHRLGI